MTEIDDVCNLYDQQLAQKLRKEHKRIEKILEVTDISVSDIFIYIVPGVSSFNTVILTIINSCVHSYVIQSNRNLPCLPVPSTLHKTRQKPLNGKPTTTKIRRQTRQKQQQAWTQSTPHLLLVFICWYHDFTTLTVCGTEIGVAICIHSNLFAISFQPSVLLKRFHILIIDMHTSHTDFVPWQILHRCLSFCFSKNA